MRYAVFGSGQRLRPIVALRVAEMLGAASPFSLRAAAAVELPHRASFIVDDPPCMDYDPLRRDAPPSISPSANRTLPLLLSASSLSPPVPSSISPPIPSSYPRLLDFHVCLLSTLRPPSPMIAGHSPHLSAHPADPQSLVDHPAALKTDPIFHLAVRAAASSPAYPCRPRNASLSAFGRHLGVAHQM